MIKTCLGNFGNDETLTTFNSRYDSNNLYACYVKPEHVKWIRDTFNGGTNDWLHLLNIITRLDWLPIVLGTETVSGSIKVLEDKMSKLTFNEEHDVFFLLDLVNELLISFSKKDEVYQCDIPAELRKWDSITTMDKHTVMDFVRNIGN